jgi:hypothetical protein
VVEIERFKDMGNYLAIITFFLWATPLFNMGYGVVFTHHYPPKAGNAPTLQRTTSGGALEHSGHYPGNGLSPGLLANPLPKRFRAITHPIGQPITRAFPRFLICARVI